MSPWNFSKQSLTNVEPCMWWVLAGVECHPPVLVPFALGQGQFRVDQGSSNGSCSLSIPIRPLY